ncbi:hypothetical protein KC329_g56 [Hortaea werneckii]|nr:hypothetical protein KC329_g56 [Hortaea werneckii]
MTIYDPPPSRINAVPITMGFKTLFLIGYQLLTAHVRKWQKWASTKANAVINCLECVFWLAVIAVFDLALTALQLSCHVDSRGICEAASLHEIIASIVTLDDYSLRLFGLDLCVRVPSLHFDINYLSCMITSTPKISRVVVCQYYCDYRCLSELSVQVACIVKTSLANLNRKTYDGQINSCDDIELPSRAVADARILSGRLYARVTSQAVCRTDLARISKVMLSALDAAMLSMSVRFQEIRGTIRDSPVGGSTSSRRRLVLFPCPTTLKSTLESERKQVKSPDSVVSKCCSTINVVGCEASQVCGVIALRSRGPKLKCGLFAMICSCVVRKDVPWPLRDLVTAMPHLPLISQYNMHANCAILTCLLFMKGRHRNIAGRIHIDGFLQD